MNTRTDATFDDALKLMGTHGKWQWLIFFLTGLSGCFVAFHNMGAVFLAVTPKHWCSSNDFEIFKENYNWTEAEIKDAFIPSNTADGKTDIVYSSCNKYAVNFSIFNENDLKNPSFMSNYTKTHSNNLLKEECSSWTYDRSEYVSTVITEWDLVCSQKALSSTVQSSFMGGVLLGCIVFGWISDKYGRRKSVLIALVLFIAASLLTAASNHYIMFFIFRFLCALGDAGVFSVAFVIITEVSGRKSRAFLGLQYMVPFSVGFMALPGIAYFIREWFWLQLAISIPNLVLLIYFWFLPESPRWLIMQRRFNDALTVFKFGAKYNGRTLPPDNEMLDMLQKIHSRDTKPEKFTEEQKAGNFLDLVRTPKLRNRSLIIGLVWFVAGMVYYGLSFSAPYIGTSIYIYIFLAAAVEVPAFILIYVFIQKIGRRLVLLISVIISGLACLAILATPTDMTWTVTALSLIGKFFSTGFYGLIFLYTVELFPTPVRNLAVGTGAMLSRLGSVVAPYITDILRHYHESIPMATFGSLCIISGILSFYLPETKGKNLPETVEEIECTEPFLQAEHQNIKMVPMKNRIQV